MTSRIIEGIQLYLKFLKEHLADCASAAVETSHSVAQIAETLPAITRTLGEVVSELQEMNSRLNRFISDQAKQYGNMGRVEKRVTTLEAHVSEIRKRTHDQAANG